MRNRSKIMILAAALVGLLLVPATAFAYTPSGDNFLTCSADGITLTCVAGVFQDGSTVTWTMSYNPTIDSGTADVNADGEATFSGDISDAPAGSEVTVTVEGTAPDGSPLVLADVEATVAEDGEIAATGSEAGLLALGAVGALAIGGAALFASRRKRTTV